MDARQRYFRRVIRVRGEDSPNVRLALAQRAAGLVPTGELIVPGVLSWEEYQKRRKTWDKVRQVIGLDAEFYEGAGVLLWPPELLNLSQHQARLLRSKGGAPYKRQARALGIDSGEGTANTSWAVGDDIGLMRLISKKTKNTAVITGDTIAIGREFGIPPYKWYFDLGGGGRQHADRLRQQGYPVQTVAFGKQLDLEPKHGKRMVKDRKENREDKYTYVNRRAQMYHKLYLLLDDEEGTRQPYAIEFDEDEATQELRRQMSCVPKVLGNWSMYDAEGRIRMLPKTKRRPDSDEITLTDLIGHSPDELDAVCLMVYGVFLHKAVKAMAGAAF